MLSFCVIFLAFLLLRNLRLGCMHSAQHARVHKLYVVSVSQSVDVFILLSCTIQVFITYVSVHAMHATQRKT